MENIQFIRQLTLSEHQDPALHFAFYNALLFVLTGICLAGLYAVYRVMYMFLTPLLWATLVGTILFPAKKRCNRFLNDWLDELDACETPLVIGLFLLPYQWVVKLSDFVLTHALRTEGAVAFILFLLIKVLDMGNFVSIIGAFAEVYSYIDEFILFCSKKWMFAFTVLYLAGYVGWIYVQDRASINKKIARFFSIPIWIFVLCLMSSYCGPLKPLVFLFCSVLLALVAGGIVAIEESSKPSTSHIVDPTAEEEEPGTGEIQTEPCHKSVAKALKGDTYIQMIFGLCMILFAARYDFIVLLVIFLGVFAVLRKIGVAAGIQSSILNATQSLCEFIAVKLNFFVHITIAGHMRQFVRLIFSGDKAVRDSLHASVDILSSIFVMCFLALTFIFFILFSAFQLHNETTHLVRLGSDFLTRQPDWLLMSARNYTGDTLSQQDIDSYVTQAYTKGREFLSINVRRLVDPNDVERADLLEHQVMQLVDDLYRMWEERDSVKKNATSSGTELMKRLKSADLIAFKAELVTILEENVETILNVLRSLWNVFLLNVSLIGSFLISVGGIVVGLGLDVVNFFIETVVFLTAVYYLLAGSKERWLPLKWISDAVPTSNNDAPLEAMATGVAVPKQASFSSSDITTAIENAIRGVFVLSAKMAVFYGLYTYFVHSLFELNIVFLPSILATIFGAIPIMAPYTVSAIGVFELFFVRGETAAAIIFFAASAAPLFFADAAFYKELQGSHPYVTGLSIVGGIYWLGLQGAIFGPMVLCSMLVLFNVYAKFTKTS